MRENEDYRILCWLVISFGGGIVLFFQLSEPIPLKVAAFVSTIAFIGAGIFFRKRFFFILLMLMGFFAGGVTSSALRMERIKTPVLERILIGQLKGLVESVEIRNERRPQLTVRVLEFSGLKPSEIPVKVRVTLRPSSILQAGDYIDAQVRLLPLPQPVRPSGYDFARDAYFKGIGAVGSVLGQVSLLDNSAQYTLESGFMFSIDRLRNRIAKQIYESVGEPGGGIAAALVTGKRGYITEETNQALRAAGIYHIVAISGLHMVIAAGLFFWSVRYALSLFPAIALRWQTKKIAAVAAMFGAVTYCVFSGASVATIRALVMTMVMLGAIVAGRHAISLRNLSLAALLILLFSPEALLGPGFQMSFAAAAALISLAPYASRLSLKMTNSGSFKRVLVKTLNWLIALCLTSLAAGLATAPFAVYHFHTAMPFGLIGNILALPLVSLIIMPLGVIGVLCYPLGLDEPVWWAVGIATGQVVKAAQWVETFGGSVQYFSALQPMVLLLSAIALIWLTHFRSHLRWGFIAPMGVAIVSTVLFSKEYVAFVDRDGRAVAVRSENGALVFVGRINSFLAEQWLRADGDGRSYAEVKPVKNAGCDALGCAHEGIVSVAIVHKSAAFEEDCRRADIIVATTRVPITCQAPVIIDKRALQVKGAAAVLRNSQNQLIVEHARVENARWPWQRGL
ncbi:ComEC/Rec2 family competence protein [Microvirga sp. W0021]|uniref:ComEC/Rec2 family competence protein n=1 Tax=Hohaiivirga grylli TaxID=3133970 RepID=A0ABV0BKG8_9HYPH